MPEKIIISFDDEKPEKTDKSEEPIIINLKTEKKENPSDEIRKSTVNLFYKGNQQLTGCEASNLKYPEGLENGFRKIFSMKLNDVFLNSLLFNNRYIVTSSFSGSIFFIDRFNGKIISRLALSNESFEKTGIVIDNNIFLNSVNSIFTFNINEDVIKEKKLYGAESGNYIWSNLNRIGDKIVFLEYSPSEKKAQLINFSLPSESTDTIDFQKVLDFSVSTHLFDSVIIYYDYVFAFYDNKILEYNFNNSTLKQYDLNFRINADTNFLLLDGKIYFNNKNNELFYFDIANEDIKYTGIKSIYINSLSGFSDNLFVGALDGWYLYKTSGVLVFSFDDIKENKIETLNKNILAVSSENKIVFHNLNKFHEAEGFTVTSGSMDSDNIISAKIGEEAIFVLSKNGILEAFNNDKLNLLLD